MTTWRTRPGGPLRGEIRVPGDKSISHRAIMLASLADGTSTIRGFLEGEDTRATAAAFAAMGVRIESPEPGVRVVHGVGIDGLKPPAQDLDCGNAGTGMRLLAGVLAGQRFDCRLVGDESLSRRPMRRVTEPLGLMGAQIATAPGAMPPLSIRGGRNLQGIQYRTPMASAQVKSSVLLAGLYADGQTEVSEPQPTRDYTESMLRAFGWPIEYGEGWARLEGGHRLEARDIDVPADFSSAAFFIVAASFCQGSDLTLRQVGLHPRRAGLLRALRLMGARIDVGQTQDHGFGEVADLRVRSAELRGIDVPKDAVPDMIDEFPVLFAAASVANGVTRVRGAEELRVKESDRIAGMATALRAVGAQIQELPDGADIEGGRLQAGEVDSLGDHRLAMSMVVAGQVSSGPITIRDCANVSTSFPGFLALAQGCGMQVDPVEEPGSN